MTTTAARGRRRRARLMAGLAVALGLVAGIGLLEAGLRLVPAPAADASGRLDDGLFDYHPRLGWVLKPGWQGRHIHADYEVTYSVNRDGHRGRAAAPGKAAGEQRWVYLGDSFTFGFGAADGDTFPEVLNGREAPRRLHLNLGHPGYSTDQEVMLAEDRLAALKPDVVVLVTYLGNDLVDNTLDYPLQAAFAKPLFALSEAGLALGNVPVPRTPKPPALAGRTFAAVVLGDAPPAAGLLGHSEIARRLGCRPPAADLSAVLPARFSASVDLYDALVERLRQRTTAAGARLVVVLLPGRSAIDEPGGYSAQYQDYLRAAIADRLGRRGIAVHDLTPSLRDADARGRRDLYFPSDGHLTAAGHRFVADRLATLAAD